MGCRQRFPIDSGRLVRIVRDPDGTLAIGRRLAGRGAWLCSDSDACLVAAVKRRAIGRALRGEVSDEAVAALRDRFPGAAAAARD
ncbi:MAG: YlxR family protein [Acidimicrobiales bacterium]